MALAKHSGIAAENQVQRRTLLNMAIAAPFADVIAKGLAGPGASPMDSTPVSADTPVIAAYRTWRDLLSWAERDDNGLSDSELQAALDRTYVLADAIVDLPSQSALDFVHKLMAYTYHGDHDVSDGVKADLIWSEARALVSA